MRPYCVLNEGEEQTLCVSWAVRGKRWLTWHGHRRNFDRRGMHEWTPEGKQAGLVKGFCERKCAEAFGMRWDVDGDHDESFVATWYPPKPIPWA